MKNNNILVGLLIISAFLIGKLYTEVTYLKTTNTNVLPAGVAKNGQEGAVTSPTPNAAANPKTTLKVASDDPIRGKPNSKVTIVEFADYQCPFCGAFSGDNKAMVERMRQGNPGWDPIWPGLQKDFIDTGRAVFIYKDYAFLDNGTDTGESHLSAQAAHCAGDQKKYWEFHDYLYSHQNGENKGAFNSENLKKFAVELGLNSSEFNNCLDTKKYVQKVRESTALGRNVGVNGTPALFINGTLLTDANGQSGAFPYSFVKEAIEKELAK